MNRTRCPHCRGKLSPGEKIHPDCIAPWADAMQAKAERAAVKKAATAAKQDRKETRERLDAYKSLPKLHFAAQKAFNAYIRERDKDQPCICCGRTEHSVDGLYSHGWDCGHFASVGSAGHHRYNEDNAHKQLVYCNRDKAGNTVEYRKGLIARIGLERVEAIENDRRVHKWTREEVRGICELYKRKLKELKDRA